MEKIAKFGAPSEPQPGGAVVVVGPVGTADVPDPGTGTADPRLRDALLTAFEGSVEESGLPGAAVRLPLRDRNPLFIGSRQIGSYYREPDGKPTKWTSGLRFTLITGFGDAPGTQLAVTSLHGRAPTAGELDGKTIPFRGLSFTEAIIAAPGPVLERLGDDRVPPQCRRLTADDRSPGAGTAAVEPVAVERLGDGATAFRIVDTEGVASHWVEIVRFPGHLIEIRIPNQWPEPPGDMMERLQRIAKAAYERAAATLDDRCRADPGNAHRVIMGLPPTASGGTPMGTAGRPVREALLDAAAALLVERGYRGLRMQDVASAAGVSRQTVYNEFGDKWGLAQAVLIRDNELYLDGIDQVLSEHADLFDAVVAAVRYTLETSADDQLKKAVLTGAGGDELLPLLTTQAEPVLFTASARLTEHAARQWPQLDRAVLAEVADAAVRLTMSHIMLPSGPPEHVARSIARMVTGYLGDAGKPGDTVGSAR